MTCVPCAKEIINGFAAQAWRSSHAMAEKIPWLVAEGRLSAKDAEELLNFLIEADNGYIAKVQAVGNDLAARAKPPWSETAEG